MMVYWWQWAQTHTLWYLDINHGQSLFGSAVVSGHSVDGLRNVVQNQIQIHFIFLLERSKKKKNPNKSESHVDTHNQQKSSISITLCNVKQNSYPYKTLSTTRRSLQYPTIKSLQNTHTFVHISAARYANMYVVCLSLMKEAVCELMIAMFLSPILTGDPLYRTLPQETHNHAS